MEETKLNFDIVSVLNEVCDKKINEFNINVHEDHDAGENYLGEVVFVSLTNKLSGEILNLVVKQVLSGNIHINTSDIMTTCFSNEINFYKNIWPTLDDFQKSFQGVEPFDKIPKLYAAVTSSGKEKIVVENLTNLGFSVFPRNSSFQDSHVKYLMKLFGKFHGISAAFRETYPAKIEKLRRGLKRADCVLTHTDLKERVPSCLRIWQDMVENQKIREKLEIYITDGIQMGIDSWNYNGRNPVFNHGDCWSSNIMFKYDSNGILLDARLIDFQLCKYGSVVSDLAYLLYSGVTKEIMEKFDYYLKIYHDIFSETLKNFNLDPATIFTFEDLKKEWKNYCANGIIIGQMICIRNKYETGSSTLREKLLSLAQHLYDNDYL